MPKLTKSTPAYRLHKASGQAVVTIAGRDHYLGPHGSKASKLEFDRLIGEWLAAGRPATAAAAQITIAELIVAYWKFAVAYYRRDGQSTGTAERMKPTLTLLKSSYGRISVSEFRPLSLDALIQKAIAQGQSRTYINMHIARIKRIFKWGVAKELVPVETWQRLLAVRGLGKGRTEARETNPVLPVSDDVVERTLPHLPEVVADMVRFQRATGCRPTEVCIVRPADVDTAGDIWRYVPSQHKTEHHGKSRVVMIGPKGQDILRKYLLRPAESFCFSPADSERKRRAERHEQRVTPLSCGNRPGKFKRNPKRTAGERYDKNSYARAIARACKAAGVEKWAPNRLRHTAATAIRKRFGLEAAQVALGHATASITQVYAEHDLQKAIEVAREVG